jgi:hypothetical protein
MEKRKHEKTVEAACQYCGHIRYASCQPDSFPRLRDGCCQCVTRLLRKAWREVS